MTGLEGTQMSRAGPQRCLDSQDTGRGLLRLPMSLGAPKLLMQTPQSLSKDLCDSGLDLQLIPRGPEL